MFSWFLKKLFGSTHDRFVKKSAPLVQKINSLEEEYQLLSDTQLIAKTEEFKKRLNEGESLDDILPEAFAVVKNTARRFTKSKREVEVRGQGLVWEMVHFDVQIVGGLVLHQGKLAEMATGEGKTLTATLPIYLNALTGRGVHVITVNDFLAARDSEWMGELFKFHGLTVGCLQHGQNPEQRREQYAADITYGTASEFGFDYLRDNGLATSPEELVQREYFYAIIDEVDSILIDEARTPLIISGPVTVSTHQFDKYKSRVAQLVRKQNEELTRMANEAKEAADEGDIEGAGMLFQQVKMGMPRNPKLLRAMQDPDLRAAIDQAEIELYRDPQKKDLYAAKEQLYFTVEEKSSEADLSDKGRTFMNPDDPELFILPDVVDRQIQIDNDTALSAEEKAKAKQALQEQYEEANQRIHNISQLLRAYCVFEKDKQYVVQDNKVVIVDENTGRAMPGRRWSDGLHQAVEAKEGVKIDRETQTLATITLQNFFRMYDKIGGMTGTAETEAAEFRDIYKLDVIVIPTHRTCLRDDEDDIIFKSRNEKIKELVAEIKHRHEHGQPVLVGTASVESSEVIARRLKSENIPTSVLNAKYHQQEAEIVARAGQRGAVTIATNMAGRGTDIKLGDGVADLGGLHVIGTERHESRRIDRQLRGRCARQGDPGSSKFYISFEDDLMRNFGDSRRISGMMSKLGMDDDMGLEHPWMNGTVSTAQKRVEQRNYQIRKHTLQYDDVMNQQRMVIYSNRYEMIQAEDTRSELELMVNDGIDKAVDRFFEDSEGDVEGYIQWVNQTFPLGLKEEDVTSTKPDAVAEDLKKRVWDAYNIKVKYEEPEAVKHLERHIMLGAIDPAWQEHLYAMDGLRQAISLRTVGQKDPLIEYKNEAYNMFAELMDRIDQDILNSLFRSATSIEAFEQFFRALPQSMVKEAAPDLLQAPASQQMTSGGAEEPEEKKEIALPIHREAPKVGRNDPCICGSGKKYKHCCGRNR